MVGTMGEGRNEGAAPEAEGAKRRSREGLAIAVTALVVLLVAAAIAYNALAPAAGPTGNLREEGAASSPQVTSAPAPDFAMEDAEGATVRLSQFEGAPVVLNFWASTCGPCQSEMPGFQAAYEQHGDEVRFVMVDIPGFNGETVERAQRFLEESGYTFPVYFDDTTQGQVLYGITSIPQTYFINADGTVEAYASGAIDASTLERGIEMVLA